VDLSELIMTYGDVNADAGKLLVLLFRSRRERYHAPIPIQPSRLSTCMVWRRSTSIDTGLTLHPACNFFFLERVEELQVVVLIEKFEERFRNSNST